LKLKSVPPTRANAPTKPVLGASNFFIVFVVYFINEGKRVDVASATAATARGKTFVHLLEVFEYTAPTTTNIAWNPSFVQKEIPVCQIHRAGRPWRTAFFAATHECWSSVFSRELHEVCAETAGMHPAANATSHKAMHVGWITLGSNR
jgi:hypothetical protein